MSEESKMGLFGSKDNTKELKADNPCKDESPERYAPYCMDSDSETYDTEALSMMDINDIIGVQSDPVGDTTLESEIAALSQMITESKGDSIRKDDKKDPGVKHVRRNNSTIMSDKVLIAQDSNSSKDSLVCDLNVGDGSYLEQIPKAADLFNNLQVVNDNDESVETSVKADSLEDNSEKHSDNCNLNHKLESDSGLCPVIDGDLTEPVNRPCNKDDTISTENTNSLKEKEILIGQSSSITLPEGTQCINIKKTDREMNEVSDSAIGDSISSTLEKGNIAPSIENISKSLQLIGEAYTSEDSQEANSNDNEEEKDRLTPPVQEPAEQLEADGSSVVNHEINACTNKEESSTKEGTTSTVEDNTVASLCQEPVALEQEVSSVEKDMKSVEILKDEQNENTPSTPHNESQPEEGPTILPPTDLEYNSEKSKADINVGSTNNPEEVQDTVEQEVKSVNVLQDNDKFDMEQEMSIDDQEVAQEDTNKTGDNQKTEQISEEENETAKSTNSTQEPVEETSEENVTTLMETESLLADADTVTDLPQIVSDHNCQSPIDEEMDTEDTNTTIKKCSTESGKNLDEPNEENDETVESSETKDSPKDVDTSSALENMEAIHRSKEFDDNCVTKFSEATESSKMDDNIPHNSLPEPSPEENVAEAPPKEEESPEFQQVTEIVNVPTNDDQLGSESAISKSGEQSVLHLTETEITEACVKEIVEEADEVFAAEGLSEDTVVETAAEISKEIIAGTNEDSVEGKVEERNEHCAEFQTAIDDCETTSSLTQELTAMETCETENGIKLEAENVPDKEVKQDVPNEETESVAEDLVTLEKPEDSVVPVLEVESITDTMATPVEDIVISSKTSIDSLEVPSSETKEKEKKDIKLDERIEDCSSTLNDIPRPSEEEEEKAEKVEELSLEVKNDSVPEDIVTRSMKASDELCPDKPEDAETDSKDSQPVMSEECEDVAEMNSVNFNVVCNDKRSEEVHETASPQPVVIEKMFDKQLKEPDNLEIPVSIVDAVDAVESDETEHNEVSKNMEEDSGPPIIAEEAKEDEASVDESKTDQDENLMEVEEEEAIDEEMKLALEVEPDSESAAEDATNLPEKVDTPEPAEVTEEQVEDSKKEEELDLPELERDKEESSSNQGETSQEVYFPESTTDDAEMPAIDANAETLTDQPLQDDSKIEESAENLKSILGNAEDVVQMLHEEQSQNSQDIMTSILDNVSNGTDLKNILENEQSVENDIDDVLAEDENLTEKIGQEPEELLNRQLEDPISAQSIDTLEEMLSLELMDTVESKEGKEAEEEEEQIAKEEETKGNHVDLLLEESIQGGNVGQDYVAEVISGCLTATAVDSLQDAMDDLPVVDEPEEASLKLKESMISDAASKDSDEAIVRKELEEERGLRENELDIDFVENPLESMADLEEAEAKLDLEGELLLDNVDDPPGVLNDAPAESSQPNSEISELESAVKFLQESEEQTIDSPLVLSPKMVESVVEDISKQADVSLFEHDDDICPDPGDLVDNLGDIAADSIAISEAEIINEAAKLESERKLAEQGKLDAALSGLKRDELRELEGQVVARTLDSADVEVRANQVLGESASQVEENLVEDRVRVQPIIEDSENKDSAESLQRVENAKPSEAAKEVLEAGKSTTSGNIGKPQMCLLSHSQILQNEPVLPVPKISERVQKIPESKVSILEERLKEPPKIEIPMAEVTRICDAPITPKNNLLIQKDAKVNAYQRMLDSPKSTEKMESRYVETPRKDSEKHDFENVGSPRIILKIAKSAIADCGEPRSPKSPKIRSATNSPNPEDSPGQKLGKIKLKLSRGGHPSIISNENVEEAGQWHTEGSALSPIGMKIKLSKSGDASIVPAEKHEDELKEAKRTESPIGMKIKLSKSGDASIIQQDAKESASKHKDVALDSPKRIDSPIGMKIKLSRTGDASIIQPDKPDAPEDPKESSSKAKDRLDVPQKLPKRTDSPLGVKIKLSRTGDASIVSCDPVDDAKELSKSKEKHDGNAETPKRTDSPIGMKIKLSKTKTGTAIVPVDCDDTKDRLELPEIPKRTESPLGMKIKLSKSGDASIIHSEALEESKEARNREMIQEGMKPLSSDLSSGTKMKLSQEGETVHETSRERTESAIGMKIKLSKSGDASIIPPDKETEEQKLKEMHQELPKRTESPIGMKIKLSKSGDASIVPSEEDRSRKVEHEQQRSADSSLGMKIKLSKSGDASIMESEKKQQKRPNDPSLEMKIKLSKTGHPTIISPETHGEFLHRTKESPTESQYKDLKDSLLHKEATTLKILKGNHPSIGGRAELTIEPVQLQGKILESALEMSSKRKDVTISPVELKKSKLEAQLSHILPEVTIQPVMSREQKQQQQQQQQQQLVFDPKTSLISRQQMNVISQEISITQVRPPKSQDMSISDKLKNILGKNSGQSPLTADCEIIEHRPELIIVNENSNSSQDVMIIDEVPAMRMPDSSKTPKKRGRPRRNPVPPRMMHHPSQIMMPRDPLAIDEVPQAVPFEHRENERPKRTCRNQKSYAPPKRARGRGRGKRKLDVVDFSGAKKAKLEQDLTAIEKSTMSVMALEDPHLAAELSQNSSELYKALKQPPMDRKGMLPLRPFDEPSMLSMRSEASQQTEHLKTMPEMTIPAQMHVGPMSSVPEVNVCKSMPKLVITPTLLEPSKGTDKSTMAEIILGKERKPEEKLAANSTGVEKSSPESVKIVAGDCKGMLVPPGHPHWLTPTSKKHAETSTRHETVSTVQVIDEDTRMSAESGSRSQTPARNIPVPASETAIINEESQGSVLSTATTESEKVKVKNRRMEINFDPDEGPFTVDKIAEYEWPLDRKGETFMIQEQISQYLGVKSFKRKYPDLKRRMVDMEERNYLRENGLVSEAMCDMGLTAVCSSEVLDVMCSDFPDQYEEYRKHMREKQVKEHSKKQKELSAAANAEKNRIDLAEMAVQSAVSWNISLNKARRETRKCSLDLQTFTIHVPKKEQKVEERRASHYPVALIPGQYTDYYREYTPAELRYYPLNTVLYGPMRPNARKFDSQSEGSQSDSDSDSSSDDSSSSSSEETQDTEESQSTMDDVDMELASQKEEAKVKCKMCFKSTNKHGKPEILIQCGTCSGNVHPSCIDLTLDTVPHIQSYAWQCTDCKTCSQCHDPANEDKMLFCDMCDRGYHIYCVGLRRVPQGRWHCQECAVCANCGSREPGGATSDRNSVAQWQHEYKKGDKNTRVYVSTLCVPCSKLWRKGRYCPHCSRCHTATRLDLEPNLVHCSACDKYLHLGCVETKGTPFDKKNYLCDFCSLSRQQAPKPLASKIFKT